MDTASIAAHIVTLKALVAAQKSLDRIRERNSVIRPRTGLRGGLATTLEAKHSTAAEYRDKLEAQAEEESQILFGVTLCYECGGLAHAHQPTVSRIV